MFCVSWAQHPARLVLQLSRRNPLLLCVGWAVKIASLGGWLCLYSKRAGFSEAPFSLRIELPEKDASHHDDCQVICPDRVSRPQHTWGLDRQNQRLIRAVIQPVLLSMWPPFMYGSRHVTIPVWLAFSLYCRKLLHLSIIIAEVITSSAFLRGYHQANTHFLSYEDSRKP